MTSILYSIIIFPIVRIIELVFITFERLFTPGVAVLGVSGIVTACTLPLYLMAEKWQHIERETQKRLAAKVHKIKSTFTGDERHMILSAYYKQEHYHPVFALRNTFSLLIQIPFFIAAYTYLSHLPLLQGTSFFFIHDLSKPDGLFRAFGHSINILPILMTAINITTGVIYTRGFLLNEKVQLYGMAVIFLALLYNSPAGLVLYWTMNNVFSLAKNVIRHIPHAKKIIWIALCVIALYVDYYTLFVFHKRSIVKHILVVLAASVVFFIPIFILAAKKLQQLFSVVSADSKNSTTQRSIFLISAGNIFLLLGLVIPLMLIASSVQEFSYIENHASPFYFVWNIALQAFGCFLFWPAAIYALFGNKTKNILTALLSVALILFLINVYFFAGGYGFFTTTMTFSNPLFTIGAVKIIIEIVILLAAAIVCVYLFFFKRKILFSVHIILFVGLLGFSILKITSIAVDFKAYSKTRTETSDLTKVFSFSGIGKNVLVIMLDRALSSYVPHIFAEKPELYDTFSGFTWYPNCASFGEITLFGAPPLFGGYEYVPEKLAIDTGMPLVERHNEALLVMPRIFSEHGFKTTVTDPSWANYSYRPDLSFYKNYPAIKAENIVGRYTEAWIREHKDANILSASQFLKDNLLRLSFFKAAPEFFRSAIYDNAEWMADISSSVSVPLLTLDEYAALDALPAITEISNQNIDTFTVIVNQLTHEPAILSLPDYTPQGKNINKNGDSGYHVNVAAFLLLKKYFEFLKDNDVYDNTRIVIVADHGAGSGINAFNPLLMFKDFNSSGTLITDNSFMTNADTSILATQNIIDDPVNPATQNILKADKSDGITVTTSSLWTPEYHAKNNFKIKSREWLHVRDNIFDEDNWSASK
ncbi:MAG: YidC/Oxa1 family membrane protein insertase [Termitinemataceae bacterium]|nr:MAG: YidC/Oxa1 family membrane protein insertase [Termitinemataceae bacterium]